MIGDNRIYYAREMAEKLREAVAHLDKALFQAKEEQRKIRKLLAVLSKEIAQPGPEEIYQPPSYAERNAAIYQARLAGRTFKDVGLEFKLSAATVSHVFYKEERRQKSLQRRAELEKEKQDKEDSRRRFAEACQRVASHPPHKCPPHLWQPCMSNMWRNSKQCRACLIIAPDEP